MPLTEPGTPARKKRPNGVDEDAPTFTLLPGMFAVGVAEISRSPANTGSCLEYSTDSVGPRRIMSA